MAANVVLAEVVDVTEDKLDPNEVAKLVADPSAGAVVTFNGVVRQSDEGQGVSSIDYTAHPQAGEILARIAESYCSRIGICKIAVRHGYGHVEVGEHVVAIAVSAEHRAEAFSVCQALIDQIKAELPIWKKQHLADGSKTWKGV